MKILLSIVSLLNGLWMLADGIFVMLKGKYMGPEKPGPWSALFEKAGIDVFKLGPLFILFGIAWLSWILMLWTGKPGAFTFGITIACLTLWYLLVGTFISLVVLIILLFARGRTGL